MSHEIENEQIAYANEVPWHGIGAQMDENQSAEEFLKAAKLDWEVNKVPLIARLEDGTELETDKCAFVRSTDSKIMTYASPSWNPVQNADLVGFMQRYVNAGGAKMEVVGALNDGATVWGLANLGHEFEVRPGDFVRGYLMITGSHRAGTSTKIQTTTVRVVCRNTMQMANSSNRSELHYRQNHLTPFDVKSAQEHVALAHETLREAESRAKILDQLKIGSEDAIKKVLMPVFQPAKELTEEELDQVCDPGGAPKIIERILASVNDAPGAMPGTGWGVINGVTHYLDHVHGRSQETRVASAMTGWGAKKKQEAEKLLLELAS